MFNASQFEKPNSPHSMVTASDGSQWYQMAAGEGMGEFYSTPQFTGDVSESELVSSSFPGTPEGTTLRSVGEGTIEACNPETGNSMWYNSAFYQEPDAPHETISSSDGVSWYAMQPHADVPQFDNGTASGSSIGGVSVDGDSVGTDGTETSSGANSFYNQAQFQQFMPGYGQTVSSVDSSRRDDGMLEVKHNDGSGTRFYDKTMYQSPRGDYQVFEDRKGGQWYAIQGNPSVERRPVYENGKAVYDGDNLKTVNVESVKYKTTPTNFDNPKKRDKEDRVMPKRK